MSCVYLLTFSNGKLYVGITTGKPERRYRGHQQASENPKKNKSVLYSAWRKHGAPVMSILEEVATKEELPAAEIKWVRQLNSKLPNGYNMTPGGEVCCMIPFSPEHLENLSRAHIGQVSTKRGKPMSPDQRAKLVDAWVVRRSRGPESAETREKKAASRRGKSLAPESREKVRQARLRYWEARRCAGL